MDVGTVQYGVVRAKQVCEREFPYVNMLYLRSLYNFYLLVIFVSYCSIGRTSGHSNEGGQPECRNVAKVTH